MVGLSRLELLTSRLSGVRSNQLSYRPIMRRKGEIFVYGFVMQSNPAVNVPVSTTPLDSPLFLALRKTFALLSVTCKDKFFVSNFVMSSNSAVDVPFSTTPLNSPSFLVIHQSFCFA